MKKLRYLLGISLLMPTFAFAPVMAAEAKSGSAEVKAKDSTTVATPTPTSVQVSVSGKSGSGGGSDSTKDANDDNGTDTSEHGTKIGTPSTEPNEMKKRLDGLKSSLKISLDDTTKKRIVLKCKPAQTVVESAEKNDRDNGTKRDDVYKKITDSIQNLIDRLKANGVDTTALAAAEVTLQAKVATFNTDMTTYQQAASDLHALDCATDPAAFQAALLTARTDREKVRTDALDIRTFITTTLKPALVALKGKLKPAETTQTTPKATDTTTVKATTTSGGTQ